MEASPAVAERQRIFAFKIYVILRKVQGGIKLVVSYQGYLVRHFLSHLYREPVRQLIQCLFPARFRHQVVVQLGDLNGSDRCLSAKREIPALLGAWLLNGGGEGGIRTLGTGIPHTRFPSVHLQPLGHLSLINLALRLPGKEIKRPHRPTQWKGD